jgi:hypothetical protein
MRKQFFTLLILFLSAISGNAQTTKPAAIEDATLGTKPTIKIECISPAGHCDNQEVTFFAPWADHYEISKRRSDTAWINETRNTNTSWVSETLKPGITGMIYKRLDEHGVYQFAVKAFKGNHYRQSDIITRQPCISTGAQK